MVESAIAAAFVHSAVDDGDGNGNSGRWSLAAGNGNVRFRWQDDDNNISMGGEMRKYLLASFILLYPSLKSGRSPGSRQEVLAQHIVTRLVRPPPPPVRRHHQIAASGP